MSDNSMARSCARAHESGGAQIEEGWNMAKGNNSKRKEVKKPKKDKKAK
jgi:hypothetical protein